MKQNGSQRINSAIWPVLLDYALLTGGALLVAIGVDMFLTPNQVVSAGVTGIGMIAHWMWGWPVGAVTLLLNIPLFLLGWRWGGGWPFITRTLYATVVMSLGIDLLAPLIPPVEGDPLIYTLFGGLLDGVGIGLVLRGRGTTGGTDILAQILFRYRRISFGTVFLVLNSAILALAATVTGLVPALYAVVVNFISARAVDTVHEGLTLGRAAFIVSEKHDMLREGIVGRLGRGVTILEARGGFTGKDRPVLYVVVSRPQITALKRMVAEVDPLAFVVVSEVHDVLGEGFRPLAERS